MKKSAFIFVTTLLVCLLLVSCRHQEMYHFLNSADKISDISILAISFRENGEMIQTEIKKIDDINTFLDDFKSIKCYTYYGDPTGVTPEGSEDTVIKISYKNDEYELINWTGQSEYTTESGLRYYAGYSVFDEKPFKSLIAEYLAK